MNKQEKKIVFSQSEPSKEVLWLHYKDSVLTLEAYGDNGWETLSNNPAMLATIAEVDDFEEFDETTLYIKGDIVRKDGKLYVFTAEEHEGSWDIDDVNQTNILSILTEMIMDSTPKVLRLRGNIPVDEDIPLEDLEATGLTLDSIEDIMEGKYLGVTINNEYLSIMDAYITPDKNSYYCTFGYSASLADLANVWSFIIKRDSPSEQYRCKVDNYEL